MNLVKTMATDSKISDNVLLSTAWFLTGLSGFASISLILACLASLSVIVKNIDEFITAHKSGESNNKISKVITKITKKKQNKTP